MPFNIKPHLWFKATTRAIKDAMEMVVPINQEKKVDCIDLMKNAKYYLALIIWQHIHWEFKKDLHIIVLRFFLYKEDLNYKDF